MKKNKVLIINDEGPDIFLEQKIISEALGSDSAGLEIKYIPASDAKTINAELPEASAVITVYTTFDEKVMSKMEKCRIIATQTIGVNTIDLKAATEQGICVTNVPDYCIEEVATHTVALALAAARKVTIYNRIARQKIWNIDDIYQYGQLHRLSNQKYGIVSFGNIGKRVASIMKSFGMEILAYDPYIPAEDFAKHGVTGVGTLEELFKECNIISLHSPLTPETNGMIDYKLMASMPKDGILINTSRGEIVKEDDLLRACREGKLSAAATDVIEDEDNLESRLYELDNSIITPHVAYYSEDSLEECRVKAALMVADVIGRGKVPKYLVNKDVLGRTKETLG